MAEAPSRDHEGSSSAENPLEPSDALEDRIRVRAYHLWEQDGGPEGRDSEYWERARELEAMGSSAGAGLLPINQPETLDEAMLQDNLGEFPDRLSDQGEHRSTPMTRSQAKAKAR